MILCKHSLALLWCTNSCVVYQGCTFPVYKICSGVLKDSWNLRMSALLVTELGIQEFDHIYITTKFCYHINWRKYLQRFLEHQDWLSKGLRFLQFLYDHNMLHIEFHRLQLQEHQDCMSKGPKFSRICTVTAVQEIRAYPVQSLALRLSVKLDDEN